MRQDMVQYIKPGRNHDGSFSYAYSYFYFYFTGKSD